MTVKDAPKETSGSHHLTRENVSFTIEWLRDIEQGSGTISTVDWRTQCGILAAQLIWLLSQLDEG